ncbi:MAG: anhydro-N-acetylmuramic acid kinase [Bacteroidota bacterium]|nr:anhydro-N-acetylmuramic acid kinase [Bacteroidota bacterium]MDP4250006.1 anhydro-N-acetylmuramic acid kinase [Bacteroidota bacterium]
MQYKVIGLMSGSSLDGLDIAYVHFEETGGRWNFEIRETDCIPYFPDLREKLAGANRLPAREYLLLHTDFGHYLGTAVNNFIEKNGLEYQVQLVASHGHTSFHVPEKKMTAQLGDGSVIAAITGIHTITDFRNTDVALGGQGAPVVPIGEKLLFGEYDLFLNIGGIANISAKLPSPAGFDVCPANRILNLLAKDPDKGYDEDGRLASKGSVQDQLLYELNQFDYYKLHFPKSLSNDFGLKEILPVIEKANLSREDALRTYTEHIAVQIDLAADSLLSNVRGEETTASLKLLATGGGAHNLFLLERVRTLMMRKNIELVVPTNELVDYKEALIIALMGALRWREEENVLSSVTGSSRNSINGAIWSS